MNDGAEELGIVDGGLLIADLALWTLMLVGISLLAAGSIGNLIDRIVNDGRVVDFMLVGIGWPRTGVFDVADMALTAGVIIAVLTSLRRPVVHEEPEQQIGVQRQ